jgi:hypothetical protein
MLHPRHVAGAISSEVPDFLATICSILGIDHTKKNHPAGVNRPIPIVDTSKDVKLVTEVL